MSRWRPSATALLEVGAYYILGSITLWTPWRPRRPWWPAHDSASVFGQDRSVAEMVACGNRRRRRGRRSAGDHHGNPGASSALTGGSVNWLVSTGEGVGAVITAILAIVVPVLVFIGMLMLAGYIIYRNPLKLYREWRQRNADEPVPEPPVMAT